MASRNLSSKVLLGDSRRLKVNGHDLPGGIQDFSLAGTELYAPDAQYSSLSFHPTMGVPLALEGGAFYSILFYSIPFYSVLFYSILFYSILFLFYSILRYSILF